MRFLREIVVAAVAATLADVGAAQSQEARLTATNPVQSDILGYATAMDGVVVVAGAPFGTLGGLQQPGRAFVFELLDGQWSVLAELRAPTPQAGAFFGVNLGIDGDWIAVAAAGAPEQVNIGTSERAACRVRTRATPCACVGAATARA